jgi:alkylation response protein AidB-like acyl-CoA dehydrogenase
MSEARELLVESANRVCADHCTRAAMEAAESGAWPATLWRTVESTGLAAAAAAEARGGAGADVDDLCALARVAGSWAIPVPLVETWLAEQMLAAAGMQPIEGPLTVGPVLRRDRVRLKRQGGAWLLSGEMKRVPWARAAAALVIVADSDEGSRTVALRDPPSIVEAFNYAREARDSVRLDGCRVADESVGSADRGMGRAELFFRGALFRAQQMAGAMERILEQTVAYAEERVQFGRPIGKFQAVQQQIAALASQVAASTAAAQAAAEANVQGLARFEIAAAKARIGEAVALVAGVGHQVHAAIGFTHEHSLHRSTRRLWSWRDEFGSESDWQAWVGRVAAQVGGESLWSYVVAARKPDLGALLP